MRNKLNIPVYNFSNYNTKDNNYIWNLYNIKVRYINHSKFGIKLIYI